MDCLLGVRFESDPEGNLLVHSARDNSPLRGSLSGVQIKGVDQLLQHAPSSLRGGGEIAAAKLEDGRTVDDVPVEFPCQRNRPLVFHHHRAKQEMYRDQGGLDRGEAKELLLEATVAEAEVNIKDNTREKGGVGRLRHMCEYMLLIDKVKQPEDIFDLWNTATAHNFHDMSAVFMHEGEEGWLLLLADFERREAAACAAGVFPYDEGEKYDSKQQQLLQQAHSNKTLDICASSVVNSVSSESKGGVVSKEGGGRRHRRLLENYEEFAESELGLRRRLRRAKELLYPDIARGKGRRGDSETKEEGFDVIADPSRYRQYF